MKQQYFMRNTSLFSLVIVSLSVFGAPNLVRADNLDQIAQVNSGIMVIGECLTKVVQDRGSVTIASSTLAPSSKEASEKTIRAHEAIKKAVRELALPDFISETEGYSVQQECSYPEGRRKCQGYRAHLATRFETSDIARLGDMIGVASQLGSEEVSNVNTFASPEKLQSAREACLETAIKNAAAKAQKLASGAGRKMGKLVSVREGVSDGSVTPLPRMRNFEAAAMADAVSSAPSIEAKPIDMRVEITAQYALE
jgi:uncharacterized protein YggE